MAWQDLRMLQIDWSDVRAPTLADLATLADAAMARLPESFRSAVEGVVVRVEDFPDEETVEDMELETPFDLLGLYRGVDLMRRSTNEVVTDLDRIFLYRRPILDYWAESDDSLADIVSHILIHEIGHHLGLSDEEMVEIEGGAEDRTP
jgi:predicted Zn-dependent protease with MMP-like domain